MHFSVARGTGPLTWSYEGDLPAGITFVVTFNLTALESVITAVVPRTVMAAFAEAGLDVALQMPVGVLELNNVATGYVADWTTRADVSFGFDQPTVGAAIAATLAPTDEVFEITISDGARQLEEFDGAISASVSFTHNVAEVLASRLLADGSRVPLPTSFDAARSIATFEIDRFSLFVVGGPEVVVLPPPVDYNDENENEIQNDNDVPPPPPPVGRPPITPATWAAGASLTSALTNTPVANAVQNIGGNMMLSMRIATENLLGTEPGWIGPNQPITLEGMNAAGQNMIVVVTQGSPTATITVAGETRTVDIAEENTRLAAGEGTWASGSIVVETIGGSAFLPLRFLLQTFEIPFEWDSATQSVVIG